MVGMGKRTILLADDCSLMLLGVKQAIDTDGSFEIVAEATTGPQVLPLVTRHHPDVVLLDLYMPGVDGMSVLRQIREQQPTTNVLLFSENPGSETIQTAFRYGACGYILKTIEPIDLVSAIRQAVEQTAYHAFGLPAMSEETAAKEVGLSDREIEILKAASRGLSNKAIADSLWVTVQTVKFHLTSVYRKLGVSNRTEAANWALGKGMHVA